MVLGNLLAGAALRRISQINSENSSSIGNALQNGNQDILSQIQNGVSSLMMMGNQEMLTQMNGNQMPPQMVSQMGHQEQRSMLMGQNTDVAQAQSKESKTPPLPKDKPTQAMHYLVEKMKWEPEFASAWLGQAVAETGDPTLSKLDVVERDAGKGRGMFQYTDHRRWPYDRARSKAIQQGKDVNDITWQIDYALHQDNPGLRFDELREGLTDPNKNYKFQPNWGTALGISPSNQRYKNKFKDANSLMKAYGTDKVGAYTRALTGEYTRPGVIHLEKREKAARKILSDYNKWKNSGNKGNVKMA